MKNRIYIIVGIIAFSSQLSFAQKKNENIGSEVVNIVKPYTPTISDAFKVKETPVIEDEENTQKEKIDYTIFSFPVASTFTPAKGKAAGVDKAEKEKIFKNYATLGLGNYGTLNGELFLTENFGNTNYIGGMLRHLSSQGGINNVIFDDKFATTSFDLTYGSRDKRMNWNVDLGLKNQVSNWYGVPEDLIMLDETIIGNTNSKQVFNTIAIGGKIGINDSFLKEATMQFKRFSDRLNSSENRFFIKPNFEADLFGEKIKADFIVDYVGGTFDDNYYNPIDLQYSNIIFGTKPSFLYQHEDLSVNIGAGLFYSSSKLNSVTNGSLFIYPNIKASYKIVGDVLIGFAGAEGGLKQNSYADFVDQNSFVSPNLQMQATDNSYDIYAGLKGKLANAVAFNLKGSYANTNNNAFFASSVALPASNGQGGYIYRNSFDVIYDDLKTLSMFAELKADFSKSVTFGINGTYNSFSTKTESEAWNLPQLKLATTLDFDINKKWYAGTNIFFVGERKDRIYTSYDPASSPKAITLDSYFDLNAHVGYKYNERFTAFLKGNNLANQQYNKWANYPVQGVQVMIGANYKFDF